MKGGGQGNIEKDVQITFSRITFQNTILSVPYNMRQVVGYPIHANIGIEIKNVKIKKY